MENEQLENLRHSAAHLLAAAVIELWPGAQRAIGPAIEEGFYYDFDFSGADTGGAGTISEKDLPFIEKKMKEIAKEWASFERIETSQEKARAIFKNEKYKLELIDEFSGRGEKLTLYKSGNYIDLCRGGHAENPSEHLKHFKLLSIAGAYWRGSEKNKMLTRIYGTAFFTKKDLDDHIKALEEAKIRDHRKIGQEQKLFFTDERVGKGLIIWPPSGAIIRNEIELLAIEKEREAGYERVVTPHLAKEDLFLASGHLPYYKDSMYPKMVMDDGVYYLKAMNCPHHHIIYLREKRSYRDLPLRLAEYGTVYRNELSGTLAGLLRVRGLSMNDAHIYCRRDQIKEEFSSVLNLTTDYFKIFGFKNYWFRISKWNSEHLEKYINEPENWEFAEGVLKDVLLSAGVKFTEAEDEAAFYGPKVDVQFKSAAGRTETMSTIQLDFAAKSRFGLSYIDRDGKENKEVFVIHRAPLSVHERLIAFLIEHYAGAWPVWLSPVQVAILPVSEKFLDFAHQIKEEFGKASKEMISPVRVRVDASNESVSKKIRNAEAQKIPYMLVVGEKEKAGGKLTVRKRGSAEQEEIGLKDFIEKLIFEIKKRK